MRTKRIFTYLGAWLAATTAAGTLTWLGVRDVIHDTVLDPPRPLPVGDGSRSSQPTDDPGTASPDTANPRTAEPDVADADDEKRDSGKPDPADPGTAASDTAEPEAAEPEAADPDTAQPPGQDGEPPSDIRNYDVDGGRAVLSVQADGVELVSAVPQPGYGVRTWESTGWLRVEFRRGEQSSSVIATWHDHPPRITTQPG